jgi:hypothetical protein
VAHGRAGATAYARRPRSPVTVRLASTSREYFARSFGAITQEKNGAKIKLNKMTIGRRIGACSDKLGIERTIVAPIPNSTALTIMLNNSDIENLVDIGSRPPRHAMPVFGVRRNARLQKWFLSLRGWERYAGGRPKATITTSNRASFGSNAEDPSLSAGGPLHAQRTNAEASLNDCVGPVADVDRRCRAQSAESNIGLTHTAVMSRWQAATTSAGSYGLLKNKLPSTRLKGSDAFAEAYITGRSGFAVRTA